MTIEVIHCVKVDLRDHNGSHDYDLIKYVYYKSRNLFDIFQMQNYNVNGEEIIGFQEKQSKSLIMPNFMDMLIN